jgi:hypothetical protein
MRVLRFTAILPFALLLLIGCGGNPKVVAVKGTVTRGGQPFKSRLSLTFYPENGGRPSTADSDVDGRFELKFDRDTRGAVVGKHKVVVAFRPDSPKQMVEVKEGKSKYHPDQDAILKKFGKREKTELSVEITGATNNLEVKID